METTTIDVPEVHCQHCVRSIEGALVPIDGVSSASVDLEDTSVTVTWDPARASRDDLVRTIEDQGYDVPAG
ncbi:heavy-metal-associated domain-containing protein [Salsipaludibacter albus]|uniref:heavy-metal-associated domain-containing protein n=1 Tax=Salsipaludibacter albus TaxID=2849650 RepID=UPI001EE45F7E|nr:copper ion binding protein [Salsipaludibacter albus]MBY5160883.1 copper ion binding protein [Salsipaludibacter albus]